MREKAIIRVLSLSPVSGSFGLIWGTLLGFSVLVAMFYFYHVA